MKAMRRASAVRGSRARHGASGAAQAPAPLPSAVRVAQNLQRLLEAGHRGLAPVLPLLVAIRLRDAFGLQLLVVLHDGVELGLDALTVRLGLARRFIEALRVRDL